MARVGWASNNIYIKFSFPLRIVFSVSTFIRDLPIIRAYLRPVTLFQNIILSHSCGSSFSQSRHATTFHFCASTFGARLVRAISTGSSSRPPCSSSKLFFWIPGRSIFRLRRRWWRHRRSNNSCEAGRGPINFCGRRRGRSLLRGCPSGSEHTRQ